MELLKIQVIEGANVYSHSPIIRTLIDLQEEAERMSHTFSGFNRRLLAYLPGLHSHHCSRGRAGGFVERLREGTLLGHVLEHVTLELLDLCGQNIRYGKTERSGDQPGTYEIVINYDSREGAVEAFRQGFRLVEDLRRKQPVDVNKALAAIRKEIESYELGVSTRTMIEACRERGIPVQRLNRDSLLQLGYGREQRRLEAAVSDATGCIAVDIACDKELTNKLLREAGIPIPRGVVVREEEEAVQAFRRLGMPVVLKPYNGNQGKGVTLNLKQEAGVRSAYRITRAYGERAIMEEYIQGRHYRVLVIGGRLAAVAERIPAQVAGDGAASIEELVARVNENPLRGEDHEKALTKIKVDPVVIMTLAQKGLELSSVPADGEMVHLRESANLSTGGIACDATERIHPENAALAVYAARVIGLDIAGVDLVIPDIAQSYRQGGGCIVEVNASPGIRMHQYPSAGKGRDVGKLIIDQLFPGGGNGRIPIIAVTGTNGKTTITRLISKMLLDRGLAVGMAGTGGIYVRGELLVPGDTTGPESARIILRHPDVQAAVLETARGGILRAGLGYDYADVAIVSNVSGDHLGQYGVETVADLAKVKRLVAEAVRPHSYVVLNADDPHTAAMTRRTRGKVIFFSVEKDNVRLRKHLGWGGVGVFVRRGLMVLCQGETVYRLCPVKQIPITFQGKARHNISNCLAAAAAGWALGLSIEAIRSALLAFGLEKGDNAGRLDMYDWNGMKVVLDYGHNAAGIREVLHTLKQFPAAALVGCITAPGDRPEESIREVARAAAQGFDRLIIREDQDLRGRQPGEIADILREEAVAAGMDPGKIKIVPPELKAFRFGLDQGSPGEILVMFYENLAPLEEEIRRRQKRERRKVVESVV
ncbi:MAG: cyanophycin synthetase [Peptococcaceae bacterium]|jgi:cyanophycin synthetase|nr:cyanophycin synthetase [Peptococcaceae bacterium]